MWVDTKGEDGPQCIHHTPVGALMAQPPPSRSCRSLQYALQNTLNRTSITVECGTHELLPYHVPPYKSFSGSAFAVRIEGECESSRPTVQCLNGAIATFNRVDHVIIRDLEFKGCGKQEQPMFFTETPTLYISNCINVILQNVTVTGQYGSGIVLKNFIAVGEISLDSVTIRHNGTYGTGIQCDIQIYNQLLANSFSLYMNNVQVVNTNTHTKYDPSMGFNGIYISASGTGRGNNISLHNVTVFNSAPVTGKGIYVGLFGDMHYNNIELTGVNVMDGWGERYSSKNESSILSECARRQLEMVKQNAASEYNFYTSVAVRVQTSHNMINVTDVSVVATYGPNVTAMVVSFEGQAKLNRAHLKYVSLSANGNPRTNRRGLYVSFNDYVSENTVIAHHLQVENSTAELGVGVQLSFRDRCTRNSVQIDRSTITNQVNTKGGSVRAVFQNDALNNNVTLYRTRVENNTAYIGGGIQILLISSSKGNNINVGMVYVAGNRAHAGGGMFIAFSDFSERNSLSLDKCFIINNTCTLISTSNVSATGGGILLSFTSGKATFAASNSVQTTGLYLIHNRAIGGVGGGLSLLYVHSPYSGYSGDFHMKSSYFIDNKADYGHAIAVQSSPWYRKALFRGITATETYCAYTNTTNVSDYDALNTLFSKHLVTDHYNASIDMNLTNLELRRKTEHAMNKTVSVLSSRVNPVFQIRTNSSMIFLISAQITLQGDFHCGAASQGILAVDSEILLQQHSFTVFEHCVALYGGAIALIGESYIRLSTNSILSLCYNYAFQRGGALYVHSPQHAVHLRCFLQYVHGMRIDSSGIMFRNNKAMNEGHSAYISRVESCFVKGIELLVLPSEKPLPMGTTYIMMQLVVETAPKLHAGRRCLLDSIGYLFCNVTNNMSINSMPDDLIVSLPDQVDGAPIDLDNPMTIKFIPGKQKQLPYKHAYDRFGHAVNTVFNVHIFTQESTTDVQLNPFSKYTADFTVILHGIPLTHGMANHLSTTMESNTTGNATPQLVLQSVDNNLLLLIFNIELQCCPPGYIYRIRSGDMGTCHCGMTTVQGIAECNETDPNNIGAVLQANHWAGYLQFNDQHSCDGQKLFTAPCPPGYCQTQLTILPTNNSMAQLDNAVCGGSNRKDLLCGNCVEGNGVAINFNGMRPVCTSCQDGLSTVGLLVWILSEWVPMLVVMFIVMLFNIDLVSGRFNSFLLFAQLLAFSSIRGDAELGPVHTAFVKIYRFLYGTWNLDFFGVLLPPYCLIPHSHLTLLQTLLLHYSIGLFPLIVAITLIALERSAEKWICCHRVDQCLRRMRRWKAKYSDGMSYDRALPAFVILGFTRFLVSSSYILVNQTITGEDGEERMVVWWQGSVPYGSIQHIAYFIPAIIILLVFVLLPSFLVLTLPIMPQLFGRLIIAVPPLRKLQRMQTFCSNVYTDRWIYHFVNVFQGCYKERYRSFSSLYLFHRIIQLLPAVFIPRAEDALRIQLILTVALLLLIAILRPYNSDRLNTLDTAILGNMVLILLLSEQIVDINTQSGLKLFYASVRMILIYLPLLYPWVLFGRKVYVRLNIKCHQWRYCQKQKMHTEDNEEPLLEDPAARLGNLVNITELRAGLPTSADEDTETTSLTDEV